MIIKNNYIYKNTKTGKFALGEGDSLVEYEDSAELILDFFINNNGKVERKYVFVEDEQVWENTPKKLKKTK